MINLAIEIRYIIETPAGSGYPKVFKVVLEDGTETFRVSPTLDDVNNNSPDTLVEYYETVKEFAASKLQELPSNGLVPREILQNLAAVSNCLDDLYQKTPLPIEQYSFPTLDEEEN